MKKLLLATLLAILVMATMPVVAGARDCCEYEVGCCCWRDCCAEQTFWYKVSYFERVESGFYTPWGTPMYKGVWTFEYVEAHDSEASAEALGMRAGYDCFVSRALGYVG